LKRIAEHVILNNNTLSSNEIFYTLLNKIAEPKANNKNDNASDTLFVKESYDGTLFKNFAVLPDEY
jgi:hypothetical protein